MFVVSWQMWYFNLLQDMLARHFKTMQLFLGQVGALLSFEEVVAMNGESGNDLQSILFF